MRASAECGHRPGWSWQGHFTPLKSLLIPSLLQSGVIKEKEGNLLGFFIQTFVSLPATGVRTNYTNAPSFPASIFSWLW